MRCSSPCVQQVAAVKHIQASAAAQHLLKHLELLLSPAAAADFTNADLMKRFLMDSSYKALLFSKSFCLFLF